MTCLYILLLIIWLLYGITIQHYVLYIIIVLVLLLYILLPPSFYHSIVYITASFILPLTRSLSDDPGFVCPDWRSELPYYQIAPWSHLGDSSSALFIGILVIYFFYLICPYFSYLLWSLTLFLQVFLYLFPAGTPITMRWFPVLRLNVRVRSFSPHVCTSP